MNTELFRTVNRNAERLEKKIRKEKRDQTDIVSGLILMAFTITCILLVGFVEGSL